MWIDLSVVEQDSYGVAESSRSVFTFPRPRVRLSYIYAPLLPCLAMNPPLSVRFQFCTNTLVEAIVSMYVWEGQLLDVGDYVMDL